MAPAVRRGACNLLRTLVLVTVLVSHLYAHGFAAALRDRFPLTDTEESYQDKFYGSIGYGSFGYGSIGDLIGLPRNFIRVRVPTELRSIEGDDYDEESEDLTSVPGNLAPVPEDLASAPGDLASAPVTMKRKKDAGDPDRTRILFLLRLYSTISNEVENKTQRMFVGKRRKRNYRPTNEGLRIVHWNWKNLAVLFR